MRLPLILALLLAVLPDRTVLAASKVRGLRQSTQKSHRQQDDSYQVSPRRRLEDGDDTLTDIQDILDDSLADTNFALRKNLEDPLPLNLTATVPLDCNTLVLHMEFQKLTGLASIDLSSLTAQSGTETTAPDFCDQVAWGSAVDILVSFGNSLVSGQVKARVLGKCNGKRYDAPLTVGITSSGVEYTGTSNMKGILGPTANAISSSETLGTLALNTPSTTVTMGNFPSDLSAYEATARSQLEAAFRRQLVTIVEPDLRMLLEEKIPSPAVGFVRGALYDAAKLSYSLVGSFVETFADLGILEDLGLDIFGDDEFEDDDEDGGKSKDRRR